MTSSDQASVSEPAEANQALPAAPVQAPVVVPDVPEPVPEVITDQKDLVVVSESTAAPVVSVPKEAITAMYETIIAIADWFHVDPKEVFNALTAKGVPIFEELKKAFTTQILVNAEKQRIVLLLLKTDGSDLGKTTFDEFLKLAPTPAPATPVAAHDENAVAPDVSEQSASPAPAANVSDDAAVTPAPAPVAASAAESQSKPDEGITANETPNASNPAPNPGGGSKKKRSQTKRKNGHRHHISRNRKARA